MTANDTKIVFEDWGMVPYDQAWERQKSLFDQALLAKKEGQHVVDTVVFCQHSPVITFGKSADRGNLLIGKERLTQLGFQLYEVDRGGDVTYHGPGQLVCYPVIDLEHFGIGIKQYIFTLEQVVIDMLAEEGIEAYRMEGATGVWLTSGRDLRERKICAIGVRSSRYITMHGFALNINTDLNHFSVINPCGFTDKGVTSLAVELGKEIAFDHIKNKIEMGMKEAFDQLILDKK